MARKMKDSGIEWIGEIPEDWKIMSLKHSLKGLRTGINPRDNFQLGEGNNFYVTIKNFKDGKLFLDEKCDRITDDALKIINKRADLKVNDILFSSISDEGHIFLIKEKPKNWTINESVFSIRPNKKIIHPKFLAYILPKNYIFTELKSKETGSTFKSIKQDHLKDSKIVVTNMNEQRYIIQFLDKKVEQIENIESTIIQEIQTLEDYKKSLITEAVTKGLDKNVEMKDSGIEWIGEIPEHWEIKKIKDITIKSERGTSPSYTEDDTKSKVVNQATFSRGTFDKNNIRFSNIPAKTSKGLLKSNDVLIASTGGGVLGKTHYFQEQEEYVADGHVTILRTNPAIQNSKIIYYIFYPNFDLINGILSKGATNQTELQADLLKNFKLPVSSIDEQEQIVDYLDKKTKIIDEAISAKQKQLEILEEYKKSLIYEYVTGKKEVEDVGTI